MSVLSAEISQFDPQLFRDWVLPTVIEPVVDKNLVFFNPAIYEGKNIPLYQFREEVFTYFAEHLRRPTKREAQWDGIQWSHPDGMLYNDMFDQAVVSVDDGAIKQRFRAEGKGWQNAGRLADSGQSFLFISLPGKVYRNPQYGAKNMTYWAAPIRTEGGNVIYEILSIPSREMTATEHAAAVLSVVGQVLERDPDRLVSEPLAAGMIGNLDQIIESLDIMAQSLDYQDFGDILAQADKTLEAQGDNKAERRRTEMANYFAAELFETQTNVFLGQVRRGITLSAIADAMHYYFSMEAGAGFTRLEFPQVEIEIKQYIADAANRSTYELSSSAQILTETEKLKWWELAERESERMSTLRANAKAFDSYRVTGCAISISAEDGSIWNEVMLNPDEQNQLRELFGEDVTVGYENTSRKDGDGKSVTLDGKVYSLSRVMTEGKSACYDCPMCKKVEMKSPVYDFMGYMICGETPQEHHIRKN